MRIIRLKLKKEVQELLKVVSKESGIEDPGFAEDMFALLRLKGNGLPAKDKLMASAKRMAASVTPPMPWQGVHLLASKRKMIMERLVTLPYFRAIAVTQTDLVFAVRRLLQTFRTLYKKVRQAQCMSCTLKSQCAFGKQYGGVIADVTKVLDADYSKKVHADCPHLPEIGSVNQLAMAMKQMHDAIAAQQPGVGNLAQKAGVPLQAMSGTSATMVSQAPPLDEDTDPEDASEDYEPSYVSGSGSGRGDLPVHSGQHICQITESFVDKVSVSQLSVLELGKEFDVALANASNVDFKPVVEVEHDKQQQNIESVTDVTKLVASQHALPDKVFDAKLAKKALVKTQFRKPDGKKKMLFVLIDSSSSMNCQLSSNGHGQLTRGVLASTFSLALARKVRKDDGLLYVRFFGGSPGMLMRSEDKDTYEQVCNAISLNSYGAGDTQIQRAVFTAIDDINAAGAREPLAKAEILVITDGDSYDIDSTTLIPKRGAIELSVLDVSGSGHTPNAELKKACNRYYKANEGAVDVKKLVELL